MQSPLQQQDLLPMQLSATISSYVLYLPSINVIGCSSNKVDPAATLGLAKVIFTGDNNFIAATFRIYPNMMMNFREYPNMMMTSFII